MLVLQQPLRQRWLLEKRGKPAVEGWR